MAATSGRASSALTNQLVHQPGRFSFFQAVRLLEAFARERAAEGKRTADVGVGYDGPPHRETVRFRVHQSHGFPAVDISQVALSDDSDEIPHVTVTFLGLTGPAGVLPDHYTTMILDRVRSRDYALRDFLDLFNHRTISFFYRAWRKYRFPFAYEWYRKSGQKGTTDAFTQALFCLVGLGTTHLRGRMEVHDEAFLHYSGHFAHAPRNALGLESVLSDYFGLPVTIHQFQGQWLRLAADEQSCLPNRSNPDGIHCGLGTDLIVGERVWSVENKFRIRLGPLSYADFRRFMPDGQALQRLGQLVRTYVGIEFDFDEQLVLRADEVPPCQLGGEAGTRLGWNTWLFSARPTAAVDDAVFSHDGAPSRSS